MSFETPNFTKIQFPINAQWSRIVVFHQKTFIFDEFTSEYICQFIQIQFSTAFSVFILKKDNLVLMYY